MRALLHLGLFALAMIATTQADAQGRRRASHPRETTVVVAAHPARHNHHRAVLRPPPHAVAEARRNLHDHRRDHDEIVRIVQRWRDARRNGNPFVMQNIELRANAWIDHEIAESRYRPGRRHYMFQLSALRRELDGFGHHPYRSNARKTRMLEELVALSADELRRAHFEASRHVGLAFSLR